MASRSINSKFSSLQEVRPLLTTTQGRALRCGSAAQMATHVASGSDSELSDENFKLKRLAKHSRSRRADLHNISRSYSKDQSQLPSTLNRSLIAYRDRKRQKA